MESIYVPCLGGLGPAMAPGYPVENTERYLPIPLGERLDSTSDIYYNEPNVTKVAAPMKLVGIT